MIKNVSSRNKGDGYHYPDTVRDQSVDKALASLIKYEIGYGGIVTSVTPTSVVIVTRIMGCVDTTTFTGDAQEMKLLVEAAAYSTVTAPITDFAPKAYRDQAIDQVMQVSGGKPLLIKLAAGMITGRMGQRSLLILMTAQEESADPTILPRLAKTKIDDLFDMMIMVRVEGASLASVLEFAEA